MAKKISLGGGGRPEGQRLCPSADYPDSAPDETSYLTLGDGDFTYSLDLCRYLVATSAAKSDIEDSQGGGASGDGAPTVSEAPSPSARLLERVFVDPASSDSSPSRESAVQEGGADEKDGPEPLSGRRRRRRTFKICCTGIDLLEDVRSKYRDAEFILGKLRALDGIGQGGGKKRGKMIVKLAKAGMLVDRNTEFSISVLHGINAIVDGPSRKYDRCDEDSGAEVAQVASPERSKPLQDGYDHVIFNHPHLGTESAPLHARFLSHFLHSASRHWMSKPGGVLHLTLVKGQAERWKCPEAAERHGLELLHRGDFRPPPVQSAWDRSSGNRNKKRKQSGGGYYQHRRHQSGRSFASRAEGGSETLTFGRVKDMGKYSAIHLPWQLMPPSRYSKEDVSHFECPHCDKSFKEERSCKNHIVNAHAAGAKRELGNKKKGEEKDRVDDMGPWICKICLSEASDEHESTEKKWIFASTQALVDHKRAKHMGHHTEVKPDWFQHDRNNGMGGVTIHSRDQYLITTGHAGMPNSDKAVEDTEPTKADGASIFGFCDICGFNFSHELDMKKHFEDFVPKSVEVVGVKGEGAFPYKCIHCSKCFREKRARLQHENFCATKLISA